MSGTLSEGDECSTYCPVVDTVPGVLDINRQQSTTSRQRVCHSRLTWHLRSTQGLGNMDRFSKRSAYKSRLQVCVLEKETRESWQRNTSYDTSWISAGTQKRDKRQWFYYFLVHCHTVLPTVVKRQDDYEWLTRQERNQNITDEKKWKELEGREK